MFKKLASNIPFNPSLIEQIPEYRAALKRELNLRMLGLCLLLLAFIGQLFISLSPAQPTLSSSPNDLITGGFVSKSQLINDCDTNVQDYQAILSSFNISCSSLTSTTNSTIKSGSYNKQLYSLNRLAYGTNSESLVRVKNNTLWLRPFWVGSSLSSVKYSGLSGSNSEGEKFFILYNSGDLVFLGDPAVANVCNSNCPTLSITARDDQFDNADNTAAKPGTVITYTLSATNRSNKTIKNYVITTNISSALAYSQVSNGYGSKLNNGIISWSATNIASGQTIIRNIALIVSSPVNKTPLSSSDANYFNMKMITNFGNTITISLPWSFSKYFELKINNGLPSVSRTISLIISAALVLFVAYFVYRTRLIMIELRHLKEDYLNGGKN